MKHPPNSAPSSSEPPVARRRIPKWAVIVSLCLLALTALGVGRHVYLGWKERRLIRVARMYLDQDKQAELRLVLENVLTLNPNNAEAFRISAQSYLKQGNPRAALPWLRKAAELAPTHVDDQIALADASLLIYSGAAGAGNKDAEKIVRDMEPLARGRADFQDLAGRVLQSQGKLDEAKSCYTEAVRLDPGNSTYRLHLGITRLTSKDAAVRDAARGDVERLSKDPASRAVALRALIVDAAKSMHADHALAMAAELDTLPARVFSDRLIYLEMLHLLGSADFQARLAETEQEAAEKPDCVLPLLYWMNGNNLALLAKDWAEKLPADKTASVPIRLEIARSYAAFGDWKRLRFYLANEKWNEFDFMRLAYLARCNRELEASDIRAKNSWMEALNAASANGEALLTLARMTLRWGWENEATDALWQAVSKSNRSNEALKALCQYYYVKRDTQGLYRAYALMVDRNPGDPGVRNNFAIFCLLLDKNKDHALSVARELYEKEPASPVYASTYALGLYSAGQTARALEVMQALKPEALQEPSIAAYYSGILAAAGREKEAKTYLERARGATLLPEEAQILKLPLEEASPASASQVQSALDVGVPPVMENPALAGSEPSATPSPTPAP
ncbi:MAG: tetratricopeptide repeat protein [Verrucomicrobiota bacterium]